MAVAQGDSQRLDSLHVELSLDKTLNLKLPLMCWSEPCMATTISVWMYLWSTVRQNHLINDLNVSKWCNIKYADLLENIYGCFSDEDGLFVTQSILIVYEVTTSPDHIHCQHISNSRAGSTKMFHKTINSAVCWRASWYHKEQHVAEKRTYQLINYTVLLDINDELHLYLLQH